MQRVKLTAMLIAAAIGASLFAGCLGNNQQNADSEPTPPNPVTAPAAAPEPLPQGNPDGPPRTPDRVRVGVLRGPTGMGMAYLMDMHENHLTANDYTFTIGGAPEEMTAGLISGEFDIAMLPPNLASVLYNRTDGEVKALSINTFGSLFILDATGEIASVEDLRGKTINATGQGSVPQYTLEHILRGNGIEPGVDVDIVYNAEHTELASLMVAGDIKIGLLPQPFVTIVTMQNNDISAALSLTDEWERLRPGSGFVQGVIVARTEFLEQSTDAVELFLSDYGVSAAFANLNPEEASLLIERFDIVPAAVARRAIPGSNLVHIYGEEMRLLTEAFLQVLFEANPQSVGGVMPGEDFYFVG